jgi:hypothetical protein
VTLQLVPGQKYYNWRTREIFVYERPLAEVRESALAAVGWAYAEGDESSYDESVEAIDELVRRAATREDVSPTNGMEA